MNTSLKKIFNLNIRIFLAFIHDFAAIFIAWISSYFLRFNFNIPHDHFIFMKNNLVLIYPIELASFIFFGLYLGIWRFASLTDLKRIIKSILLSLILITLIAYFFITDYQVPRSIILINSLLLLFLMSGSRIIYRIFKEQQIYGKSIGNGNPVIVACGKDISASLIREINISDKWNIVAILVNDKSINDRVIENIKIIVNTDQLLSIVNKYQVKDLIITHDNDDHSFIRKILDQCNKLNIQVLTVPLLDGCGENLFKVSHLRPIDVNDLLRRSAVNLDISSLDKLIHDKTIFVSGAGGSIGSEICRQIIEFKPKILICFDISEYFLYILEQELSNKNIKNIDIIYKIGDVKDKELITNIFNTYRPSLVYHAAAYKHVPMMENYNVIEALKNNVLGTYNLACMSKRFNVLKFVLISTDKAVKPSNVMGASKRIAEKLCLGLQENKKTDFVIVRFGNVLGSSGSVIPKFQKQISSGGPITITHKDITRYFMSIPEASQLVLQSSHMGNGGQIFVLEMGESVKIVDLAKDMIRLCGLDEDKIEIKYTGLRPGEKLYEELLLHDEVAHKTSDEKLKIVHPPVVQKKWVRGVVEWINSLNNNTEKDVKIELKKWIKEYKS